MGVVELQVIIKAGEIVRNGSFNPLYILNFRWKFSGKQVKQWLLNVTRRHHLEYGETESLTKELIDGLQD